jgi:hypothetical protein
VCKDKGFHFIFRHRLRDKAGQEEHGTLVDIGTKGTIDSGVERAHTMVSKKSGRIGVIIHGSKRFWQEVDVFNPG